MIFSSTVEMSLLFVSTLLQVFLVAMQSIQIIKEQKMKAALCAMGIAATNVIMVKMVPSAGMGTLIAYVVANGIGVPLAMLVGQKKSLPKT